MSVKLMGPPEDFVVSLLDTSLLKRRALHPGLGQGNLAIDKNCCCEARG